VEWRGGGGGVEGRRRGEGETGEGGSQEGPGSEGAPPCGTPGVSHKSQVTDHKSQVTKRKSRVRRPMRCASPKGRAPYPSAMTLGTPSHALPGWASLRRLLSPLVSVPAVSPVLCCAVLCFNAVRQRPRLVSRLRNGYSASRVVEGTALRPCLPLLLLHLPSPFASSILTSFVSCTLSSPAAHSSPPAPCGLAALAPLSSSLSASTLQTRAAAPKVRQNAGELLESHRLGCRQRTAYPHPAEHGPGGPGQPDGRKSQGGGGRGKQGGGVEDCCCCCCCWCGCRRRGVPTAIPKQPSKAGRTLRGRALLLAPPGCTRCRPRGGAPGACRGCTRGRRGGGAPVPAPGGGCGRW